MKKLVILTAILFMGLLTRVQAQGFYLGAAIGNTFVGTEFQDVQNQVKEISENSTGYKFFAGYSFPAILGVEGGYRNLGTLKYEQYSFETQTTGWDVFAMGRLQFLGLIDAFAKAGYFFWKTENTLVGQTLGENGKSFAWGLGAGVHFGPIGVRLEYENFNVKDPVTLSNLMLGATYGF